MIALAKFPVRRWAMLRSRSQTSFCDRQLAARLPTLFVNFMISDTEGRTFLRKSPEETHADYRANNQRSAAQRFSPTDPRALRRVTVGGCTNLTKLQILITQ